MGTMTRQDLLAVTEATKNKIIERLVTKYDVQAACDSARDHIMGSVRSMQLENQTMIRQLNAQKDQSWRKVIALEDRLSSMQRELKATRRTLDKILEKLEYAEEPQSSDFSSLAVK